MASCPNCGFDQPDSDYCAKCGINMSSFVPKRSFSQIIKSSVTYISLLALALILSSYYIFSRVKDHVLEQKQIELSGSVPYDDLDEVVIPTRPAKSVPNNTRQAVVQTTLQNLEDTNFESGDLNVYYVYLSNTSPVLSSAQMINANVGTVSNLSSYLTSDDDSVTGSISVINMDSWNVPSDSSNVVRVFNSTRRLPESEEYSGLQLSLAVGEILPELVRLGSRATFTSVSAVSSNLQNQPLEQNLGAEIMDAPPIVGEPSDLEDDTQEQMPNPEANTTFTLSTTSQDITSNQVDLDRGSALLISKIIPKREISQVELELMPRMFAQFMNQSEFLSNTRDFVILVEYKPL